MKNVCIVLLLLSSILGFSQNQNEENNYNLPEIIPGSPTVGALMHFEEVPVSYYSGQPGIALPLYTKSLNKTVGIPINLNYSTMGVRIDERSGWTGTGWALDGVAVISRTVRGSADELDQRNIAGHATTNANKVVGVYHNDYYNLNWSTNPSTYYTDNLTDCNIQEFLWNASGKGSGTLPFDGAFDNEPDLYQLSLFGSSARFVVVKEGSLLVPKMISNDANLDITVQHHPTRFEINSFTVRDTNGTLYTLDIPETTASSSWSISKQQNGNWNNLSPKNEMDYVSAWKISEIKTSNGISLANYSYQDVTEVFETPTSVTEAIIKHMDYDTVGIVDPTWDTVVGDYYSQSEAWAQYNNGVLMPKYSKSYNTLTIESKKVSAIDFYDQTSVEFETISGTNHPEYDASGVILKHVILKDQIDNEFKRFTLNYTTTANNRLFLDSVQESFSGSAGTLDYNLVYTNKEELPGFGDLNKDPWGYYREELSASTPSIYQFGYSADKNKVTTGILEHIAYPTGGKKEFIFESNTFSHSGSRAFTDDEFANYNPDNFDILNKQAVFDNSNTSSFYSDTVETFTIARPHTVYLTSTTTSGNIGDIENTRMRIEKMVPGEDPELVAQVKLNDVETFNLEPGNYRMILFSMSFPNEENPVVKANAKLYYKDFEDPLYKFLYGGGVRVKEIRFTDSQDVSANKSVFYNYNSNEGGLATEIQSSGVVDGFLTNKKEYSQTKYHITASASTGGAGTNITTTAALETSVSYQITEHLNSVYMSLTGSNYVGYGKVTMYQTGNGKTIYHHTTPEDFPTYGAFYGYPFIPEKDKSYLQGAITLQEVYNEQGQKLQESSYVYDTPLEIEVASSLFIYDKPCWYTQYYASLDHYLAKTPSPGRGFMNSTDDDVFTHGNCTTDTACDAPVYYKFYPLVFGKYLLKDKISKSYYYDETGCLVLKYGYRLN